MNTKTILIKGGTVITGNYSGVQDVLIQGESISAIGNLASIPADTVIDADGLLVMPGAIDTHVHFDDEFMGTVSVHDYYTGTVAAAFGGVTTIVDFSNQLPGRPLTDTVSVKKEAAKERAVIDYGVHPVITNTAQEYIDEIHALVELGAPTIKCYMTYKKDGLMVGVRDLKRVAAALNNAGGMLMIHAEDDTILEENISKALNEKKLEPYYHAVSRPVEAENRAIRDCVEIARETGVPLFIVHLSSADGMEIIGNARAEGVNILAETCTHYLVFTSDILKRDDGYKWICSPPLRDAENREKLWNGLIDDRVKMVTSDDAAYSWEAKLMGKDGFHKCPNGIAGIEARFSILYSEGVAKNRIPVERFVDLVSTVPARLFGLSHKKGAVLPGLDADIVLFDPKEQWVMNRTSLHMATDYAAYDNIDITGRINYVFSRGEMIINDGRCTAEPGRGRYIHRKLRFT